MNISRLEIFNSRGYQIPIQYTKSVTFTIIGNMYRSDRNYGWREDASGYFVLDENCKIVSHVIENNGSTFSFDPSEWDNRIDYYDATLKLIDEVIVTITVGENTYSKSFTNIDKANNVFTHFNISTGMRKEYVRAKSGNNEDNALYTFFVESIMPSDPVFFIEDNFREMLEADGLSVDSLYPSTQFLGSIDLEQVSVGLAGVETLFILERQEDGSYKRPQSSNQMLRLEVPETSNVKFVKYADDYIDEDLTGVDYDIESIDYSKVYWSEYKVFDLVNDVENHTDDEPLAVTVGFLCEEEGCYQDILSIYTMDHISDQDKELEKTPIGYISVNSEAIGEDERYRTLFTNFGIPDPKDYQEVFKDMPIYEESHDWDFINKKSKQLFLSYSQIFPYVGTYKALINAVKFLGYDDIYFKEWFMHFDGNFESKVSYESLDINTGVTLQSKLRRVGVSLEEFIEWKKLNQLSLIYKINEEDEEYDNVRYWKKNSTEWEEGEERFDLPTTRPVYSYLNLEILTKLYSLKEWLEKYILNINCQIIDITGEGVYFMRFKEPAYTIGYETFSEEKEEHLTPIFDEENSSLELSRSSATIDCTLREIKAGMSYKDLSDKKIKTYINKIFEAFDDSSLNEMKKEEWYDSSADMLNPEEYCIVGKPASISMPFEELQYELTVDTSCGTLKEGVIGTLHDDTSGDPYSENIPLLVIDNEMYVFKNKVNEIEFTEPPVIRIKSGVLKKPFGDWNSNTKYSVQTYFDSKSRHTKFTFQNEDTKFHREYNDYVTLYPRYEQDGDQRIWKSKLKYTSDNKYNVPMLVIENYDTYDHYFLEEKKAELAKRYIDASSAITAEYISATDATEEEQENLDLKRELLHQEAIESWQNDLSVYKDSYDTSTYVEGFNKYILLIDEGFIEGKEESEDQDVDHLARIVFEPDYSSNGTEQKIFTEYSYRSKMCPSIEFDVNTYNERYQAIKDEYKSTIEEIDVLIDSLDSSTGALTEDAEYQYVMRESTQNIEYFLNLSQEREREKQAYITIYNTTSGKGRALEEYLNWMIKQNSSGETRYSALVELERIDLENKIKSIKDRFLSEYESQKRKAYTKLLKDLAELKDQCFIFHKDKKFTVNHLGEYSLVVKGVDGYNAPFASKCNTTAKVVGKAPSILMLDSNENNRIGTVITKDLKLGEDPTLWPSYRRNVIKVSSDESSFDYADWSYILDTPKKDDFLKLSNLTERVNKIITNDPTISNSQIKIVLNDENPKAQNLFYKGALVKMFFIDRNTNELVDADEQIAGPYIVSSYQDTPLVDEEEGDNNYIVLDFSSNYEEFRGISQDTVADINSKKIDCYAGIVSRIEISSDNIENDYVAKTSKIKIHNTSNFNNLAFKPNQCIKIEFAQMTYVGDTPSATNPEDKQEIVTERYTSGTTYRIKEAWYDSATFNEVYVIDGIINTDLLVPGFYNNNVYNYLSDTPKENIKNVPYKIRCTLAPAHTTYTSYIVQASEDAREDSDRGSVRFKDNWRARNFIDTTFSYTISKFNVYDAYRDWFKETSAKTFNIHTDPVTNAVGNNIIVCSDDVEESYESDNYMRIWDVYVNQGKSDDDNILAYQVTNDLVPISLNYGGLYHFVLTSIDPFGNRISNKSNGFMKALES